MTVDRFFKAIDIAIKALAINACILILMTLLSHSATIPNGDKTVYTTRTGECYHLSNCSSLSRSKYETTIEKAVRDGYYRCSNCDPPMLKGADGRVFSLIHYIVIVPFVGMWACAAAGDVLSLDSRHFFPQFLIHTALAVLLSLLFDMAI